MRPESFVGRLVGALEALSNPTSDSLAEVLRREIDRDELRAWARFDDRNYRRNLVVRRPAFEVRLLCWLPKQRTSLHGHDRSACAFRVVQGTATEMRLGEPDQTWSVGDVVAENRVKLVHQVANLGGEPLVCLNVYAPALTVDQPPGVYEGRHVVIVGGGVSGAALAIHLLAAAKGPMRVSIIETRQRLGHGPAYGTTDPTFRLNVPAERMSLFPSQPSDFLEWASERGAGAGPGSLLPRQLFGEYVEDRLGRTIASAAGKVWFQRSEAVAATARGVTLADGTFLPADAVVLATGNQLPAAPPAVSGELLLSEHVIGDPWSDGALARIAPGEDVLVIGTGLTAVDVLVALRARRHRGAIVAVSRRGLLPRPHLAADDPRKRAVQISPSELPSSARLLARWLREEIRRREAEGVGWQSVVDALRPHATEIWRGLPPVEQRRFMTKLRTYWEVIRHRAPAESLATVAEWRAEGQLEIVAGSVARARTEARGVRVDVQPARGGAPTSRVFQRIVLCTGPQTDVRRWTAPLFRILVDANMLCPDPLRLGVVTDASGRVIDADGVPSSWLFTIGGLRRPHLWETTAVPELVRQAVTLADLLATPGSSP